MRFEFFSFFYFFHFFLSLMYILTLDKNMRWNASYARLKSEIYWINYSDEIMIRTISSSIIVTFLFGASFSIQSNGKIKTFGQKRKYDAFVSNHIQLYDMKMVEFRFTTLNMFAMPFAKRIIKKKIFYIFENNWIHHSLVEFLPNSIRRSFNSRSKKRIVGIVQLNERQQIFQLFIRHFIVFIWFLLAQRNK